jgi:hypothetical protein
MEDLLAGRKVALVLGREDAGVLPGEVAVCDGMHVTFPKYSPNSKNGSRSYGESWEILFTATLCNPTFPSSCTRTGCMGPSIAPRFVSSQTTVVQDLRANCTAAAGCDCACG